MNQTIMIALISLLGTIVGTFGGILTSNKLTVYRIEMLEKKLDNYTDSHHELITRVVKLEDSDKLLDEKIKVVDNRIRSLESGKAR